MSALKVFVCGVTGNQGGAVSRALLAKGATVNALSRDTSSAKAKALAALGVNLFQGSYDDAGVVAKAVDGCDAAFLNSIPSMTDMQGEFKQGSALLGAFKTAGVKHVVYSSGLGSDAPEKMYRWDPNSFMSNMVGNTQRIEEQVRTLGFTHWTILRPGHFDTNYMNPRSPQFAGLYDGEWATALTKDSQFAMIDPLTIGNFAAAAFYDTTKFHQQEIPLGEQLLTPDEVMAKLGAATDRQLKAKYFTDEEVEQQLSRNPFLLAHLNMRNMDVFTNLDLLKSYGVPLSSFDAFLEREKETLRSAYKL